MQVMTEQLSPEEFFVCDGTYTWEIETGHSETPVASVILPNVLDQFFNYFLCVEDPTQSVQFIDVVEGQSQF